MKLQLPTTLSVLVLSAACAGCGGTSSSTDAMVVLADATPATRDAGVTDASAAAPDATSEFDAGCQQFEAYDPQTRMCVPVI